MGGGVEAGVVGEADGCRDERGSYDGSQCVHAPKDVLVLRGRHAPCRGRVYAVWVSRDTWGMSAAADEEAHALGG
jgi:hypothetical protein